MSVETECACGVVDRYEALPLLYSEGFRRVDAKPNRFALRVEGIKVDVCDDSQRCLRTIRFQLVELFVCEFRFGNAARRCD